MKDIRNYPKIELHCHLDGSIPPETLRRLAKDQKLSEKDMTVSRDCTSLKEFLEKFALPLSVMQTREGLTTVAHEFLLSLVKDHVRYVEVRFAPMLSVNESLTCREVIEAVLEGLGKGQEETGIRFGLIVCAMRNHSYEENFHALLTAMEFYKSGVCAFDLAGDEAAHPNGEFQELFRKVKNYRIPFTIHGGECGSLSSVEAAVEFGARRIGHGIALIQSPELMKTVERKGIGLELCPTSNFQTKAVKAGEKYPLKAFCRAGLKATVNTDNRTVSGVDLTHELEYASGELTSGQDGPERSAALEKLQKNAIDTAFADDSVKNELWNMLVTHTSL